MARDGDRGGATDAKDVEGCRTHDGTRAHGRVLHKDAYDRREELWRVTPRRHDRRARHILGHALPLAKDVERGHEEVLAHVRQPIEHVHNDDRPQREQLQITISLFRVVSAPGQLLGDGRLGRRGRAATATATATVSGEGATATLVVIAPVATNEECRDVVVVKVAESNVVVARRLVEQVVNAIRVLARGLVCLAHGRKADAVAAELRVDCGEFCGEALMREHRHHSYSTVQYSTVPPKATDSRLRRGISKPPKSTVCEDIPSQRTQCSELSEYVLRERLVRRAAAEVRWTRSLHSAS